MRKKNRVKNDEQRDLLCGQGDQESRTIASSNVSEKWPNDVLYN